MTHTEQQKCTWCWLLKTIGQERSHYGLHWGSQENTEGVTILLVTQSKMTIGLCQGTWVTPNFCQELTHVCVNRSQNREWGDKNLTHYGESSHKECCPICIHPYKQGQTTREDSKHSCIHCRVLAMGMQTHISDTALRKNKQRNRDTH